MIGRWFGRLGLGVRIGWYRFRLSRTRGRLKNLQTDAPATRSVVRNELRRVRSLERELHSVRNDKQLRYWRMRLDMATPYLKVPFTVARGLPRKPATKPKAKPKTPRRGSRRKSA